MLSANEGDCTVVAEMEFRDIFGIYGKPNEMQTVQKEYYFNRANLSESEYVPSPVTSDQICWKLKGENVGGAGKNVASMCGDKSIDRLIVALENLYTRHCKGHTSEY